MVSAWIWGSSMDDDLSSMGSGTFFCGTTMGLYEMLHSEAKAALAAAFLANFLEGPGSGREILITGTCRNSKTLYLSKYTYSI